MSLNLDSEMKQALNDKVGNQHFDAASSELNAAHETLIKQQDTSLKTGSPKSRSGQHRRPSRTKPKAQ